MISNQSLTCSKGTSLTFEIDMDTGSDLTGAMAQWALAESWFDQAKVYLTKTGVGDGLFIGQDAGVWKITINLAPTDTIDIPSGLLYHDCKVLLQNGDVEDVANGPFYLDPSVNVLSTNAPSTRNLRSVPHPLASIGQTATGTVGALARNLQATQTLGLLGQTATATYGGAASPDWYVDSVTGSDSNNGTAQGTPFATLAAVSTAIGAQPTKTIVALKRGSHFRESLSQSVTSAVDYGNAIDPLPIIDGSDVITGWTVNGTQAAVWEKAVTLDTGGRPRIFEDGNLMPWVTDLATCASTAGSRVLLDDGGSVTIQMHPTGGGNPNTNGKTYEVTKRSSPVFLGDNCSVKGVHAKRAISNNGAIQMGRGAIIERCLSVDGSKHNILVGSGSISDTISIRADAPTPTEPSSTFIVGFDSRGISGQTISLSKVGFLRDGQSSSVAFFTHDLGSGSYSSISAEQIWMVESGAFQPSADVLTINGYYSEKVVTPIGGWFAPQVSIRYFQLNSPGTNTDTGIGGLTSSTGVTLQDGVGYSDASTNGWVRLQSAMNGATFTIQNTAFATSLLASRTVLMDEGWSSGTMVFNGNIVHSSQYGSGISVPSGITYTGDHNDFAKFDDGQGSWLFYHGTLYHGLTEWRAATSQDLNSLDFIGGDVSQLFSGTYSAGDFRLAGTGIGAAAAGIGAGPQNHWNWNTKAAVSGPPSAWPTVPKTLADAITYMTNPTSWSW
jgi:hypothetical protein